jgi:hypothetical protein
VDDDHQIVKAQNRNYLLAEGFQRIFKDSPTFTLFLRYQAQSERMYRRAIEEFERLKRLRRDLPNEPISDIQPHPGETTCATEPATPPAPERPAPPLHPPEHYGPDGELRFPYDRPPSQPLPDNQDLPFDPPGDLIVPPQNLADGSCSSNFPAQGVQSRIQGEVARNRMSSHPIRDSLCRDGKVFSLLSTPWDGRLSYS